MKLLSVIALALQALMALLKGKDSKEKVIEDQEKMEEAVKKDDPAVIRDKLRDIVRRPSKD